MRETSESTRQGKEDKGEHHIRFGEDSGPRLSAKGGVHEAYHRGSAESSGRGDCKYLTRKAYKGVKYSGAQKASELRERARLCQIIIIA